jgi:hypothetical protein
MHERRVLRFVFAAAVSGILGSGCAHSANEPARVASATTTPTAQWKPGSHAASVFNRLQDFRQRQRKKFETFLAVYGASHGDVNNPATAELRKLARKWLSITAGDYENLPVYMKAFDGTGPYRRLVTKPGYSYVAGTVSLPCNATSLHPQFETAFAYVGGWGVGDAGKAVDAGFQRSNAYDNYAAFINAQGFPQISKEPRFVCGHPVAFRFYAASDNELRLWAKGLTENNRVEVVEARLEHPPSYGWPANGGGAENGIVLKRMTTIGQNDATSALPKGVEWDADGSYFGLDPGEKRPLVHWSNLVVGQVDAQGKPVGVVPWKVVQTDESPKAGMFNYPGNPRVIRFTCTACPDESDAINLSDKR